MIDLSTRVCCVIDGGLFPFVARALAPHFGKTLYYRQWESAFPKMAQLLPGDGLDGVDRIKSWWPYIDEIDLFVFPDLFYGPLQVYLRSIGKRVWGAGMSEELEVYRAKFKGVLEKLGLPVAPYRVLHGITELRRWLKEHDNQHVKSSLVRGDCETWFAESYELAEEKLDYYAHKWGAAREIIEIICEEHIENKVAEIGFDGWCIDGQFAASGIQGVEVKDECYAGHLMEYDRLIKQVRYVNTVLSPVLAKYGHRGFLSWEAIIDSEGQPYLIDPCQRAGSPPSEAYLEAYANWPEIIWEGAAGNVVEPEPTCASLMQVIGHSEWADQEWSAYHFPREAYRWYKFKNECRIDGNTYSVPQCCEMYTPCSIVGIGDTDEEARQELSEHCDNLTGTEITIRTDQIFNACKELEKAEALR